MATTMDQEVMFMHVDFANILCDGLWTLYQTQKCTDMVLNCSGVIINVHSLVLNIMAPSTLEQKTDSKTINLDININIMGPLLEYIYKGVTSVSKAQVPDLKLGASKLGLHSLLEGLKCYDKELKASLPVIDGDNNSLTNDEICNELQTKNGTQKDDLPTSEANLLNQKYRVIVQQNFVKRLKKMKKYRCVKCGFTSIENRIYSAHLLTHSTKLSEKESTDVLKCNLCDYVASQSYNLSRHVRKKHGVENKFKCQHCEFSGTSFQNLCRHIQNNHSNDRPYSCTLCDYKSKTAGDLKKHTITHTRPSVNCEVCDKTLSCQKALTLHMQITHLGVNPRQSHCHLCSYKCSRKYALKAHLKTTHNIDFMDEATPQIKKSKVDGQYECKHCNYKSSNYTLFKHHLGVKHYVDKDDKPLEPKHKCRFCDFKGFSFLQLYYHKRSKHNKSNFKCNLCSFQSVEKSDFRSHLNNEHGNYRPFTCGTCNRGFISKAGLKRHVLTHGDDKFICEVCGNSYALKIYLAKHIKMMHIEDKPFQCDVCSYATRTRQSLKEHVMRIHSNCKPPKKIGKNVKTLLNTDAF